MLRHTKTLSSVCLMLLLWAPVIAQGPASCGFHLDIRGSVTSTHAAVADMPNSPGEAVGIPPPFPGNPYTAHAIPGSPMVVTISGNALAYGPGPLGPGSCVSLLYAIGAPMTPILLGPPFIPTCYGGPAIIGILPIGGSVFDSCGLIGPPPPFGFFDGGSGRFVFTGSYPPGAPPIVTFQAVGITPGGAIWVTNAVNVIAGPNPAEMPVPFPIACGGFPPLDDGQAVGIPTPPGFAFYGFPTPAVDMATNGYVDFVPGSGPAIAGGCDTTGSVGDFGCAPATVTARPRIDVNHSDYDFGVPLAPPFIPGMTMEFRPPGPTWQNAIILRWKNAPAFGLAPGSPGLSTANLVLELHGGAGGGFPPIVPNRIVVVRSALVVVDQVGVGPGIAGQGYGGPPPAAPTCGVATGTPFMATFAPPFGIPFFGVPGGVIHMNLAASSAALLNSAAVFTPMPGLPPVAYTLVAY